MRFGEGRISGAFSIVFGAMALGGVLCFLFPERLTTPEFRAQYDVEIMRRLLEGSMLFAGACARSLLQSASSRDSPEAGSPCSRSPLAGRTVRSAAPRST